MEIHSNQRGSEKDENIERLLSLEDQNNEIEIVIHVNMLKEGWDVTNLYTIIPLRTAASATLREQTIGRGLRLPYGQITNEDKVDKLTIVSHDRFQEIVEEANKPDSIIRLENVIEIDDELITPKETVTGSSPMNQIFEKEQIRIEAIDDTTEKQKAQTSLDTKKQLVSTFNDLNTTVKSVQELTQPEVKKIVLERIKEKSEGDLFSADLVKEAEEHYDEVAVAFANLIIEIFERRIRLDSVTCLPRGHRNFSLSIPRSSGAL